MAHWNHFEHIMRPIVRTVTRLTISFISKVCALNKGDSVWLQLQWVAPYKWCIRRPQVDTWFGNIFCSPLLGYLSMKMQRCLILNKHRQAFILVCEAVNCYYGPGSRLDPADGETIIINTRNELNSLTSWKKVHNENCSECTHDK